MKGLASVGKKQVRKASYAVSKGPQLVNFRLKRLPRDCPGDNRRLDTRPGPKGG